MGKKTKKKYPSRGKYDKSHPTISARLPIEIRDKLRTLLESQGMTLAKVLTSLANGAEIKEPSGEGAKKPGYLDGIKKARKLCSVSYKCSKCGQLIVIDTQEEKEAAGKLMTKAGWGHSNCPDADTPKDQ
jgi:hypothetical protein